MVHIAHMRQVNDRLNWRCGAYCLKMIMDYYGTDSTIDEIWNRIKCVRPSGNGEMYAMTYLLAQYSINRGLPATVYKTDRKNAVRILQLLDRKQIPAILSITQPRTGGSHFVIYSGIKGGMAQIVDPDEDTLADQYIYNDMVNMWDENLDAGVTGFAFVIFGRKGKNKHCIRCGTNHPIVDNGIARISNYCICPNTDRSF